MHLLSRFLLCQCKKLGRTILLRVDKINSLSAVMVNPRYYRKQMHNAMYHTYFTIPSLLTYQKNFPLSVMRRTFSFSQDEDVEGNEEEDEQEYGEYVREICAIPGMGHRVLVIQPDIKAGSRRYVMTSKELKLEETCALIRTLPRWKVVDKKIVRTDHENTSKVFGSGNYSKLVRYIRSNSSISAVVVGIDKLTGLQINTLQKSWGVPVYDRYTIVLQIFKDHALSPEAKLQVALAEIPYVRSRLILIHGGYDAGVDHLVVGSASTNLDKRRMLLQRRESRLKKELSKVRLKRQEAREQRSQKSSMPTIAVVGYTNAGKTTLIKALTQDQSLQPQNQLFATLDVTPHEGQLASRLKVTYIDTVGFISDMPTTLLDAFTATLEDAMMADIVIHVRDASHPDRKLQVVSVHNTLRRMLSIGQMQQMIEVYNKVDLIDNDNLETLDPSVLKISATSGQGLSELGAMVENSLLQTTGLMRKTFRIPNGQHMLNWLYQEAAVQSVIPDPQDCQRLIVEVIINKAAYGKFKRYYGQKNSRRHEEND